MAPWLLEWPDTPELLVARVHKWSLDKADTLSLNKGKGCVVSELKHFLIDVNRMFKALLHQLNTKADHVKQLNADQQLKLRTICSGELPVIHGYMTRFREIGILASS
ncbi:MAG TPA: hypothetical protein V6C97_21550 [Oculatellaceae cyanobacterium]